MSRRLVDLRDLPPDHPKRNTPLKAINPVTRVRGEKTQPKPCGHWKIGGFAYNELAQFWMDCNEFLVEVDE